MGAGLEVSIQPVSAADDKGGRGRLACPALDQRIDARGVGGIHGLAHEHEDIRVHVVPRIDALAMLGGRLNSAAVIIALQWLELNRSRLLDAWRATGG